jgi:hypothetical protein
MMRPASTALGMTLAFAIPAQGQGSKRVWEIYDAPSEVRLVYGVPEAGNLTLAFICEPGKPLVVATTVLPRRLKTGLSVQTTLSNGTVTAVYKGQLGFTEPEGYYVEAPTAAGLKAVDVLRSGSAVTIGIPGRQVQVPLDGVAGPLAQFEAACFRKR